MLLRKALELMEKYSNCPDCGSDRLGNGKGTLNIDEDGFIRTCNCGFSIKINSKGEMQK
ncbi:DUF3797 domain-containing protein [Pullulanibacillus sp. KACC 23026]|uniref:DUF3797 domain-containing protein n=1 Tax=Pullulanibacillus sp. KACC 23026 TaxID=3028315 RepID=UPI0023AEFEF3|nr:DUF3797 domain-containing protein [Pullulanibacillus sp. KACC 23026]WEG14125.1 DUF3797 domain-containing protein [Pullulanibacillus sp. KACC 23026]